MAKFAWEPDELLILGEGDLPPQTAEDLLDLLDVRDRPSEDQHNSVRAWLAAGNQVDPLLRVSLEQLGLPADPRPTFQVRTVGYTGSPTTFVHYRSARTASEAVARPVVIARPSRRVLV